MTAPESPWLLLAGAVEYSKSSRTEILLAVDDGTLRGHQRRKGGTWRFHRDDLDAWLRGEPMAPIRPMLTGRRVAS